MKKLTVVTIVGTRPEIIRLARVMPILDQNHNHIIAHTGQNYDYELNEIFFDDLELRKPDYYLGAAGESSIETIANTLTNSFNLLNKIKPDAVLVLGDTNSCLSLLSAKRLKIPTFHMEAGNRCFDFRVPEEINRRIVDHIADINLTYSERARDYLLREGLPPDRVIKSGSPMFEVLSHYKIKIENSNILSELNLEKRKYFVVSIHREENVSTQQDMLKIKDVISKLSKIYSFPIIVSLHPRTKKQLENYDLKFEKNVVLLKPLKFTDYNKLQIHSKAVLSDSGTISEESSILGFPALNLREAHERPEAMDEGVVMMVGMDGDNVLRGLSIIENEGDVASWRSKVDDYTKDNVSIKVSKIILSYTDYVNKHVWMKQ